ncbi:hypothetical protein BDZ91DRAFT_685039 [Kalaharituber pfeilii]|nr:hypothetical protein BDZ91DRAFT_685039 [Kalaharituber pfeilii]
MDEFDPNLLYSPILRITLKSDCKTETKVVQPRDMDESVTLKAESKPIPLAEFFIHKSLLASLSPELHKHVNNEMREGQEGILELSDVEEETLKAFLLWAYKTEYRTHNPKSPSSLLYHTKLYAFGDRFNVAGLMDLTYCKITTVLMECGMVTSQEDITSVISAIAYACENLRFSTVDWSGSSTAGASTTSSPPISGLPSDRLLRYFTQYSVWALDSLRTSCEFINLLSSSNDFAIALVVSSSAVAVPPWVAAAGPPTLSGRCQSCSYSGAMRIKCPKCGDIGDLVDKTVAEKRISGTSTHYEYTCPPCNKVYAFSGPVGGRNTDRSTWWRYDNVYYLHCGKCDMEGNSGKLELV